MSRDNVDDGLIWFPDDLAKDIAKGTINFDNLTQEKWDEIRGWFYFERYGQFMDDA